MHKARLAFVAAIGTLAVMLGGPGDCRGPDGRRTAICRQAVSAVAQTDAPVEILRIGRGATPASVRVDYRSPDKASERKARWLVCGFGVDDDLVSVATEHGALSGASVHLLKRYFREAAEVESPAVPRR